MLKETFFMIRERIRTEKGWTYRIALNASHPVYQAHFPQNPVTPGVCIVQLIKEIVEDSCSTSFFIRLLKNVKFLHVLNPLEHEEVTVDFTYRIDEDGRYSVTAVLCDEQLVFSKVILYLTEITDGKND